MCGSKVAEGDKELVIYCVTTIQEGADDGLDLFDTGIIKFEDVIRRAGKFLPGTINDGCVAKGRVL